MKFIENLGNFLIILIAIVTFILVILIIIEKKLYKKIIKNRGNRNIFFIKQIANIPRTDSKNILGSVNKIAMDFFKEAFKINSNIDNSQLINFFNQKKDFDSAKFCSLMNEALYSKKKVNQKISQKLIILLIKIIKNNPLLSQKEKQELQKIEQKQNS